MIIEIINILRKKFHKKKLHYQFLEVQKWQSEMYQFKTHQELNIQ